MYSDREPKTIDDVVATLTEIGSDLTTRHGENDGVLAFNRLYEKVTRAVGARVSESRNARPGDAFFAEPDYIERLDVIFAEFYFRAVDSEPSGAVPAAWEPLFKNRDNPDIDQLQFVIAGMNAHIDNDLALALLRTWDLQNARPRQKSVSHEDYTKVDDILKEAEQDEKSGLAPEWLERHRDLARAADITALWAVDKAREAAWHTAHILWDLQRRASGHQTHDAVAALGFLAHVEGQFFLRPRHADRTAHEQPGSSWS